MYIVVCTRDNPILGYFFRMNIFSPLSCIFYCISAFSFISIGLRLTFLSGNRQLSSCAVLGRDCWRCGEGYEKWLLYFLFWILGTHKRKKVVQYIV